MRWRLILEEFVPDLHYIKGERNIVADAHGLFSRDHACSIQAASVGPATGFNSPVVLLGLPHFPYQIVLWGR
jgi:hypothetical protein